MLSVKNLTRKYKNGSTYINAVDNITTNFKVGDFVFVVGASGSGKSTLLNILCGLDTKIEGTVEVDGVDTSSFTKKEWAIYRNHYVGFIFQEYNLIEHLKVWENVALPLMFQGISRKEAKLKAIEELKRVGLDKFANKSPNQMSGGQNQRVAIARALVTNPKVIMADEPTGALDTELGYKIIEYLKKVSDDRVVVVVSHDEELAETYATRIITLEDGKVIDDSAPVEEQKLEKKEVSFKRPKMKFGMMLKFAKNNISSRMVRSLFTSTIVSIGYISIFLLTFLIMGINGSIIDTLGKLVPEDQYQIYNIENTEITTTLMDEIEALDEVENIRYNVSETVSFQSRLGNTVNTSLYPVPYDEALLTQFGELYGRVPENDTEIIVSIGTAQQMRNLSTIDEDSYQYLFDLVEGVELDLAYISFEVFDEELITVLGSYTIVGMTGGDPYSSNIYMDYDEVLILSEEINDEITYKTTATAYLTITDDEEIEDFYLLMRDDYNLVVENFFTAITSGVEEFMMKALKWFIGIASISLVVSGILIGLVIYTSIIERIKEIGILTAIGAKPGNIVGIFLAESAFIGLLSSGIATLLALFITRIINSLFANVIEAPLNLLSAGIFEMTLLSPSVLVIAIVIGFSIIYSMFAGLIPSFKAASLNAIKALRKE